MKIINGVGTDKSVQSMEKLVYEAIMAAQIECEEVHIDDFDNDRIWLTIDGADYNIRIWDIQINESTETSFATVRYSLFKMVGDENGGGHAEEIIKSNTIEIEWEKQGRTVMRGEVKWFNNQKGFGFIYDDQLNEIFVHHTQIQMEGFRYLDEGDIVEFEVATTGTDNRTQAVNVKPLLTRRMIERALRKDDLYLCETDQSIINGNLPWMVVDINNIIQTSEHGMDIFQVAEYAGIDVSGLKRKK